VASGLKTLSNALALRLRSLARAADRLDRLESGSGAWLSSLTPAEIDAAAGEMTLRALRTAADPFNYRVLRCLADQPTLSMPALESGSGLDRLSLGERVNDLIQVGLASREIDTDSVQITDAGRALAGLLGDIQRETAERLAEYLIPVTTLE
jgi:hypothetical protein